VLIEHGVIVNPQEEVRLSSPLVASRMARAIAAGALRCPLAEANKKP